MKHICKCGTVFSLEIYHDISPERYNTCHTCYRKILKRFDTVKINADLVGFNIGSMSMAYAKKDDIMMILHYRFDTGMYLLVAGGFYFWAQQSEIKRTSIGAIKYAKTYEAVTIADHMMYKIQRDINAYLDTKATVAYN